MTTIIWDFDHTLFDANLLKEDMLKVLADYGVTSEQFRKTYRQALKCDDNGYDYDPKTHLSLMTEDMSGLEEALVRIEKLASDSRRYIFDGAEELLSRLKESGARQILLTLGNRGWQEKKVIGSGLNRFFDRVITVAGRKDEALKGLVQDDNETIVVNDNGKEILVMQQACPQCRYILVKGPKDRPEGLNLELVEGMKNIEKAIGLT